MQYELQQVDLQPRVEGNSAMPSWAALLRTDSMLGNLTATFHWEFLNKQKCPTVMALAEWDDCITTLMAVGAGLCWDLLLCRVVMKWCCDRSAYVAVKACCGTLHEIACCMILFMAASTRLYPHSLSTCTRKSALLHQGIAVLDMCFVHVMQRAVRCPFCISVAACRPVWLLNRTA